MQNRGKSLPKEGSTKPERDLRQSMNLTQQQFAELLGVSFVTLNRWENGQSKPSAVGLSKLREIRWGGSGLCAGIHVGGSIRSGEPHPPHHSPCSDRGARGPGGELGSQPVPAPVQHHHLLPGLKAKDSYRA